MESVRFTWCWPQALWWQALVTVAKLEDAIIFLPAMGTIKTNDQCSTNTYWVYRCNDAVTIFCKMEDWYIDWWSWWWSWALSPGVQGRVEELCHIIVIFKCRLKWKFIYIFVYFWWYWGFGQVYNHVWRFKVVSASSLLYFKPCF